MAVNRLMQLAAAGVSTGNPWDISEAVFSQSFSVSPQNFASVGLFFKPDGTRMYACGFSPDTAHQYNLSTAWDVSSATFATTKDISSTNQSPNGLFFKPDGTRMYVADTSEDAIMEYNLSSAWDLSSASYSREENVSAQELNPQGVFFKPDGTRMYVIGSGGDEVNEFSLSSAWNVTTSSFVQNLSLSAKDGNPRGIYFRNDGLKMYFVGDGSDQVHEYDLSSAWDISSASFLQSFDVSSQDSAPRDVHFKDDDGLKMYVIGAATRAVYEYDL